MFPLKLTRLMRLAVILLLAIVLKLAAHRPRLLELDQTDSKPLTLSPPPAGLGLATDREQRRAALGAAAPPAGAAVGRVIAWASAMTTFSPQTQRP